MTQTLLDLINIKTVEKLSESGFRPHLGASLIGQPCDRALWYTFRWAHAEKFDARMLRLFSRGHSEERKMIQLLQSIGCRISELAEDGRQHKIVDCAGHFGGSLDGMADHIPTLDDPNEVILLEFKTHNAKSFAELVKTGSIKVAKLQHYVQMQTYMFKREFRRGLYMAVNKDNDDLYFEFVDCDPEVGRKAVDRANRIIFATAIPDRIGRHPSWHDCKFCSFSKICHYGEPLAKNCRTCKHSVPLADAQWGCNKWEAIIPSAHIPQGCDAYEMMTD